MEKSQGVIGKIEYQLTRSRRRYRSVAIKVDERGVVRVMAPMRINESEIERFLMSKYDWLLKVVGEIQAKVKQGRREFVEGEKHWFFGEEYPLVIFRSRSRKRPVVNLTAEAFEVEIAGGMAAAKEKLVVADAMLKWYLNEGKKIIRTKVDELVERLGLSYGELRIKRVSSIWGSCSARNNLNFNRKLIMAPHEVVDYVIAHEVCHIVHKHHRKSFWAMVAGLDPAYKKHVKWLRENSHLLSL